MTRGVSCALATCIATSSEPKVKTMNDSIDAMKTCSPVLATSGDIAQFHDQPNRWSR